jgi:hypothetical protein
MSATMEDALTEALLWLHTEPQDNQLIEAEFGAFADGSGYWWTLQFRRYVHNGEVRENRQDSEKRIGVVVRAWSKRRAELDAPGPETAAMPRVPS